jgi:cytochrome oxidase Cu insertion factor (SCO1/SenC/PrrC family)
VVGALTCDVIRGAGGDAAGLHETDITHFQFVETTMNVHHISFPRLCAAVIATGALILFSGPDALAHEDKHRMPDHLGMDAGNTELAMRPDGFHYKRGHHAYAAPAVPLRDRQGRKVDFAELMEFDGPVLLNFIFTSCATICPVQSATFGQVQPDLAAIDDRYLMVSVSIDPEYDTPRRLREYAELHDARDNWVMLTGQFDDIFAVVRAFDAVYKGENKMYHRPLTFLRANAGAKWLRLEGLLGAEELAEEYAKLLRPEVN